MTTATSTCTLHAALGAEQPCPGRSCVFWDADTASCVFAGAEHELLHRDTVSAHLLELRRALESCVDFHRSTFVRRLNEEQDAETAPVRG